MAEKFYERSKVLLAHKAAMSEMVSNELRSMANSKKTSEKSYLILKQKLEKNLMIILQSVDPENTRKIGFEQLGRVFNLLEIFFVIRYDESFKRI